MAISFGTKQCNELRATLQSLSRKTWWRLSESNRLGAPCNEEPLTEDIVFGLSKRETPSLHIRTFTRHEESRDGADLAIWLEGVRGTNIGFHFQAKRRFKTGKDDANYHVDQTQLGKLLDSAMVENANAFHLLYTGKPARVLASRRDPFLDYPEAIETDYGCCVVASERLKRPKETISLSEVFLLWTPWHFMLDRLCRIDPWPKPGPPPDSKPKSKTVPDHSSRGQSFKTASSLPRYLLGTTNRVYSKVGVSTHELPKVTIVVSAAG